MEQYPKYAANEETPPVAVSRAMKLSAAILARSLSAPWERRSFAVVSRDRAPLEEFETLSK